MEINIPSEYQKELGKGRLFACRWFIEGKKDRMVLLLNQTGKKRLTRLLDQEIGSEGQNNAFLRLIRADIQDIDRDKYKITLPENLAEWLQGEKIHFQSNKLGLIIFRRD